MHATLHRHHRHVINLANHQPAGVTLRGGTHKSRYLFVRYAESFVKLVGKSAQPTAEHKRDAWIDIYSGPDDPGGMFGAFVKTRACHSLRHFDTLAYFSFS